MKRNVASQKVGAQMVSATDGSAFTGTVTVYVTGDAGTQAIGSVGSGICTHEGNGFHTYAPAQAETDYDHIAFTFIGTGAVPATIQVFPAFPQTGDSFGRIGATGSGLTSLASQTSLNTLDDFVDTEIASLRATQVMASGTSDSGTTTTMVDAARTEADTDYWKGNFILFTSGNIAGQCRLITGFNAGTDIITFTPATTQAVGTQTYEIIPAARMDVGLWAGSAANALISGRVDSHVGSMQSDVITAAVIAADAIGAAELSTGAVNEIQSGLATSSAQTTAQTDLDDIQTRLPAALVSGRIDSNVGSLGGTVQSATDLKDFADDGYDPATNKVEGVKLADTLTTYTSNTPQTGDSFARIGPTGDALASLAQQPDLLELKQFVDTEVAAIKAKTDQLTFTTANKVDSTIQTAGDFAQAAADKVWATAARALTDKVGFALSSVGIQAIWDAATSALTTAGSIGKKLADWVIGVTQTGDSFTRIGNPMNGSVSTDIGLITEAQNVLYTFMGEHLPAVLVGGKMDSITSLHTGEAQGGSANGITLTAGASATNDFYNRNFILILSGTGALQPPVRITDYVGSTKVAVVAPGWVVVPDSSSVYVIIPASMLNMYVGAK